jgi:hypothetical protein
MVILFWLFGWEGGGAATPSSLPGLQLLRVEEGADFSPESQHLAQWCPAANEVLDLAPGVLAPPLGFLASYHHRLASGLRSNSPERSARALGTWSKIDALEAAA